LHHNCINSEIINCKLTLKESARNFDWTRTLNEQNNSLYMVPHGTLTFYSYDFSSDTAFQSSAEIPFPSACATLFQWGR
jgi:hypothetical protein